MKALSASTRPSRLPWARRWLRYGVSSLAVAAALAYAAVPWCVPGAWLARRTAAMLSQTLGRPATVERFSMSWTQGVCIEGLTVHDLPGAGRPHDLLRIRCVRFALTPIRTLLAGTVDRLELDAPRLWVSQLPDGRLNIDDLGGRRQGGLPTFHYVLRNAVLYLDVPDLPSQCRMDVAECRLDRATGLLRVSGDATLRPHASPAAVVPGGRFSLNGRIRVPKLKRGVKLTGGGELRWENVELKEIPFRRMPQLGIDSLEGRTDGYVRLEAFPDLGVNYELRVRLDGVVAHRQDRSGPERIQDGQFAAKGHWDPAADLLIMNTLDYQMPALRIHDTGRPGRPALVLDRAASEPLRLDVAGEVADVEPLRRQFPAVDDLLHRLDLRVTQGGRFTLQYSQGPVAARARMLIDADAAALTRGDSVRLAPGVAKRLAIDVSRSLVDGGIDLREARLDIDDLHWAARASFVPLPEPEGFASSWIADFVTAGAASVSFTTGHMEQLAAYLPGLDRRLGDGRRRGPLEWSLTFGPGVRGPAFRAELSSPAEAEIQLGDHFDKPRGVPLTASGSWVWDVQHPGRWQDLAAECVVGRARVALDGREASVRYALAARTETGSVQALQADLSVHLPLVVSRIEQLLPRLPRVARALEEGRNRLAGNTGNRPIEIEGDVGLVIDGAFGYRPGDWAWRGQVRADLIAARMRAGDLLDKRAGEPASLVLGHRAVRAGDQLEHELTARAVLPGAEADAGYMLSGAAAHALTFRSIESEQLHMALRVTDAARALPVCPRWSHVPADYNLAGNASIEAALLRGPKRDTAALTLDGTGLQFAVHGRQPFFKAAGVPCGLEVRAGSRKGHPDTWSLEPGHARLAHGEVRWQGGDIALSPEWAGGLAGLAALREPSGQGPTADVIRRMEIVGTVRADADDAMRGLAPGLEAWMKRLGITGRVTGPFRLVCLPSSLRVTAELDATGAGIDIALPSGTRFVKPTGAESAVSVDIERRVSPASAGGPPGESFVLHEVVLKARDNRLDLSGELAVRPQTGGGLSVPAGSLCVRSSLNRLDELQSLFPDRAWPRIQGRLATNLLFDCRDGAWRLGPSDVTLQDVAMDVDDVLVQASGRVKYSGGDISCEALGIRVGTSELTLSGRTAPAADSPAIQIGVYAPHLDIDELRRLAKRLANGLGGEFASGGSSASSRLRRALDRAVLDVGVQVDRLRVTVPDLDRRADVRAASGAVYGRDGTVEIPICLSVDGGVVDGRIRFFLRAERPYFDLSYSAKNVAPGDLVQAYLRRSFPGFTAAGPLTLIDRSLQRLDVPQDPANYPVGSGELIIDGGYVEGKAAPDWLVRIFPGLNLARYDFLRMHDWFTKQENGRIDHRMIFQGRYYHLYMEGFTDAARNIRYEVGIDLLARLESKYWVESRQGRIPLFLKTGRLRDDGTLEQDTVQFTPMGRVIESLVQNNLVQTMYYAVRKQVLNLMETRRGVP